VVKRRSEKREELRVLLFQIREKEEVRREEFDSFVRYSGLQQHQIQSINVFERPHFRHNLAEGYDAVFVGGASAASVLEPDIYPFVNDLQDVLLDCLDHRMPVFASCFGFQLAAQALGGKIIHDDDDHEMGSIPISLRPAAAQDLIFHDTPSPFMAVSVHQERTLKTPPQTIELAYTAKCCHAFKVIDRPFWAFQFHPEVDKQILITRLTIYKSRYTRNNDHLDEVLRDAKETPESNILLRKFVDRVLQSDGQ